MASFIPGIAGNGVREKRLKKLFKVSIVDDVEYERLLLKRIWEQSIGFTCASMHASAVEAIDLIPQGQSAPGVPGRQDAGHQRP